MPKKRGRPKKLMPVVIPPSEPRRRGRPKKVVELPPLVPVALPPIQVEPPAVHVDPVNLSNEDVELRGLTIGRPRKKPTEKEISDYVKFIYGQIRVKLRTGVLDDIDEMKICLKLKKRF